MEALARRTEQRKLPTDRFASAASADLWAVAVGHRRDMQAAAVWTFLNTARRRLRHFGAQAVPALSLLVPVARIMADWG
eukprot:1800162-Alexandrium_andersonii.AAC.1